MPNTQQRVLPRFPATIIGVGPVSVSIAGGVATVGLASNPSADPNVSQYLRALNIMRVNGASTLDSLVPASIDDPGRIILTRTTTVPAGGAFEALAISKLNLTPDVVTALRALAALQLP